MLSVPGGSTRSEAGRLTQPVLGCTPVSLHLVTACHAQHPVLHLGDHPLRLQGRLVPRVEKAA